jgi:hypothetical protein
VAAVSEGCDAKRKLKSEVNLLMIMVVSMPGKYARVVAQLLVADEMREFSTID